MAAGWVSGGGTWLGSPLLLYSQWGQSERREDEVGVSGVGSDRLGSGQ